MVNGLLGNYLLYQKSWNDEGSEFTPQFTELKSNAENLVMKEGQENGDPLDLKELHAIGKLNF